MNKKPIIAIAVCVLILGAAVIVLTTDFRPLHIIEEPEKPKDEPLFPLGNITSFDDAVNAFSFDIFPLR